ncbi:putative serine/threonine protein kinase [Blattamonas nauphoetae]|uniref:non-specific serine/threonine protein kinase n=1 Tax=Blattamonas nauphoetae TaxID=2049346 RepID=A0ABQ9YL77_9EUKA|nr:putative serine/threonine protein kinase [Blattamonas nauphoetae]
MVRSLPGTLSKGTQTLPRSIIKGFEAVEDKIQANRFREKDKADRATHQQVLDRRTYLVLLKLFKNGLLREVNECVSTDKEANVHHAMSPEGRELAVKLYKTSILIFKDRDRYVTGEFRFRNDYARSNPRKMVSMWAEKEYRNLLRLSQAGIHALVPRTQRQHVLVMDFVGDDGNAASRLKNTVGQYQLTKEQLTRIYWDTVDIMKKCTKIATEELWVIGVSQSVEHDHPHSLEFLRRDADIINKFFRNYGVHTLSARELFDYIVDAGLASLEKRAAHVEKLREMCEGRSMTDIRLSTNTTSSTLVNAIKARLMESPERRILNRK